jgi:hypothetical protein
MGSARALLHSVAERKGRINQVVYYQHNKQHMYPEILQAIACNLKNRPGKYSTNGALARPITPG